MKTLDQAAIILFTIFITFVVCTTMTSCKEEKSNDTKAEEIRNNIWSELRELEKLGYTKFSIWQSKEHPSSITFDYEKKPLPIINFPNPTPSFPVLHIHINIDGKEKEAITTNFFKLDYTNGLFLTNSYLDSVTTRDFGK